MPHATLFHSPRSLLQVKHKQWRWQWRWQRFTVLSLRFYSSLAAGAAAITTAATAATAATATATGATAACNKSQFKWRPSMCVAKTVLGVCCSLLAACHMPHAACHWFALALASHTLPFVFVSTCSFVADRVKFVAEPVESQPAPLQLQLRSCHIFQLGGVQQAAGSRQQARINCTLRVR